MATTQIMKMTFPKNIGEFENIEFWAKSLGDVDYNNFIEAQKRQLSYRQDAIDAGRMIIDENSNYKWINREEFKINKPYDNVWLEYYNRWIKECNIVVEYSFVDED